jgi:hypothetical protein
MKMMLQRSTVGGPLFQEDRAPFLFRVSGKDDNRHCSSYIAIPQLRSIALLEVATGKHVGNLPMGDDDDESSTCITAVEDESLTWLVVASRSGGQIRIFSTNDLIDHGPVSPSRVGSLVSVKSGKPFPKDAALSCIAPARNNCLYAWSNKHGLIRFPWVSSDSGNDSLPYTKVLPLKRMKQAASTCELKVWTDRKIEVIVLYSSNQLMLYIDVDSTEAKTVDVTHLLTSIDDDPLTTVQVSPTNGTLACGLSSGAIKILHRVLPAAIKYRSHVARLQKSVVVQTVHWHAHAVAAMAYESGESGSENDTTLLYTGGAESVLVTWQLQGSAGMKPLHTLPRIAPAGIAHILLTKDDRQVIVCCQDQSMHAYEAATKQRLWTVQGLAVGSRIKPREEDAAMDATQSLSLPCGEIQMTAGAKGGVVVISGLEQAPGSIHWYDMAQQRVIHQLEVVPFNRISGTDRNAPNTDWVPKVTHSCFRKDYLCTVDVVPTENNSLGHQGLVTTIRFWHSSTSAPSYECVAAMTSPHGPTNRIHAITVSQDGRSVISVSNDEKALRLWQQSGGSSVSEWICRCKVSLPSGYANHNVTAVAFSNDSSVFALAMGEIVTLWDHEEVKLLTSFRHMTSDHFTQNDDVEQIQFLPNDSRILLQSPLGVSVRSPYTNGPTDMGWNWIVPSKAKDVDAAPPRTKKQRRNSPRIATTSRISQVHYLPQSDLVAMVQYNLIQKESRIILVDATTGEWCPQNEIAAIPIRNHIRAWSVVEHGRNAMFSFYCLTSDGELLCLSNQSVPAMSYLSPVEEAASPTIPLLAATLNASTRPERRHLLTWESKNEKKGIPDVLGLTVPWEAQLGDASPSSTNVPLLRGPFVLSFMGRHFRS